VSVLRSIGAYTWCRHATAVDYAFICLQVPWLVIFGVLTLVPQTAVCYYLMLAAWVSRKIDYKCSTAQSSRFCQVITRWALTVTVVLLSAAQQQPQAAARQLPSGLFAMI
jgi:hypothetical protein